LLTEVVIMLVSGLAVWEPVQRYPSERSKAVHPPPVVLVSSTLIAMVLGRFGPGAAADETASVAGRIMMTLESALTMPTRCDISGNDVVQSVPARFSAWNRRVQAVLFRGWRLA
jgi:hypothetical protein